VDRELLCECVLVWSIDLIGAARLRTVKGDLSI